MQQSMKYGNYLRMRPEVKLRRSSWLLLAFITVVSLLSYHDLAHAKNAIGEYNESQDQLITLVNEGSITHRVALVALGIVSIVSLARYRGPGRLTVNGLLGWSVIVFAVWAFISPLWAEDISLSIRRVLAFVIIWIAAMAIVRYASLRDIVLWIFFSTVLFVLIGLSAEIYFGNFQPLTTGYRFSGTMHPNYQGMQCGLVMLSAIAAAALVERWRVFFWVSGLVGLVFMALSGSRTSLAAAMIALLVYLVAVTSKIKKIRALFAGGILACLLLVALGVGMLPNLKSAVLLGRDDPGNVDSLSGRMTIWKDVGAYISERPVLGYGYGGFWSPAHVSAISDKEDQAIPNSHSTYIEYLVTLGPVGLISYAVLLFAGIRRAFRSNKITHNPGYAFCGAILVFCALNGFLEVVVTEGSPLMFPVIVVLAYVAFTPLQQDPQPEFGGRPQFYRAVEATRRVHVSVG
jgi:exopolysaccharide production protein ExoQ